MKKYILLYLIIILTMGSVFSQGCLPGGITFSSQEEIDNFQTDYSGCTEIEGYVFIVGDDISNLNGLSTLTTVGQYLVISDNIALTSLAGLNNLHTVGDFLVIGYNNNLTDLTGLNNLVTVNEYLEISGNNSLINFTGLDNLTTIGGHFRIYENSSIISFTGLESLTTIGGELYIFNNLALTTLVGLNSLTSIGERLFIGCENGNYSELTSLEGLNNLTTIGWDVTLLSNSSLLNLDGLNNLTTIGGTLTIDGNDVLESIEGITNIEAESISNNLNIRSNPLLSTCEVNSVCNYLANPNGNISIFNNASGCNSVEEVEDACLVSVHNNKSKPELTISPNPAKAILFLSSNNGLSINEIKIYNQFGQIVMHKEGITSSIDISMLDHGMYIIELFSDGFIVREKLMVEN